MQPESLVCPFCHTEVSMGVKVCRGCQAEIKYNENTTSGMFLGFVGLFVGLIVIGIGATRGHAGIGLILGVILGISCAIFLGKAFKIKWSKEPMFYRQMKH